MLLTKPQQLRFWREWQAVIRHQGWQAESPAELNQRRLLLLQKCGFTSLTAVDRAAGFDRVLAALGQLQDKITPTIETDHPEHGERRRRIWQIAQITKVLTIPYAEFICRARFGHTHLDDLTEQQLTQFRNTLNARLQARRRQHPAPAVAADCPY